MLNTKVQARFLSLSNRVIDINRNIISSVTPMQVIILNGCMSKMTTRDDYLNRSDIVIVWYWHNLQHFSDDNETMIKNNGYNCDSHYLIGAKFISSQEILQTVQWTRIALMIIIHTMIIVETFLLEAHVQLLE